MHEQPEAAAEGLTTPALTRPGDVLGTVGYIAPEQVLWQPATARSDVFAFGVVMYEMLTGVHPFRRETVPETHTAVLREDPPSLARAVPGVGRGLIRLIERCLAKEPADRPASARELAGFLEALADVAETESISEPTWAGAAPIEV